MSKKILALLIVCSLGVATSAFGAPTAARGAGVVGSPHDMTAWSYVDSQTRVCAFCHTPHHAATTGGEYLPLWSRAEDTKQFNVAYNSSTINASALKEATSDKAIGPTRLCMSCHDGTIAPDQHYGNTPTAAMLTADGFPTGGANQPGVGAGTGLNNDHPVGFDYVAVAVGPDTNDPTMSTVQNAASTADPWIRNSDASFLDNEMGLKISDRLYVAANGTSYMTCATCHDVHNKKNKYIGSETVNYLVLSPQAGSKLCLSCHIK